MLYLETGSKQYRVAAGDTLEIERWKLKPGAITFDRVCWLTTTQAHRGLATVAKASVVADVVAPNAEKENRVQDERRKGIIDRGSPPGIDGR